MLSALVSDRGPAIPRYTGRVHNVAKPEAERFYCARIPSATDCPLVNLFVFINGSRPALLEPLIEPIREPEVSVVAFVLAETRPATTRAFDGPAFSVRQATLHFCSTRLFLAGGRHIKMQYNFITEREKRV